MDFAKLKKSSSSFDRLLSEVDKISNPKYTNEEDTRYWRPELDKAGNGLAVIRFLPGPAVDGDDSMPWVRYFDHGFQGPSGKWYIEKSLTTLDQKDPVGEFNSKLWNASTDENSPERKQARAQKRRLHYVSNILVITDPKNPENEGKVFLFRYGKKIMDKIMKMMNPDLETEQKINPFDFWSGANFKLKITRVGGFVNYDESVFLNPGPVYTDDAKIEELWKSEYSLTEIVDPKHFKSYDELKRKLEEVLEEDNSPPVRASNVSRYGNRPAPAKVEEEDVPWPAADDDETDADLEMFRKLAEED